jgi:hypothetical protein
MIRSNPGENASEAGLSTQEKVHRHVNEILDENWS